MNDNGLQFQLPQHAFGLIIPNRAGVRYVHQAGGVAISYPSVRGVYLPLDDPIKFFQHPSWYTRGETDVTSLDVADITADERDELPSEVIENSGFSSHEGFSDWLDESPQYGNIELLSELMEYNYYAYNTTAESPVLNRWDDEDEIWAEIDELLPFMYEEYDFDRDPKDAIPEDAPAPMEALKWIEITGTKTETRNQPSISYDGDEIDVSEQDDNSIERKLALWAEELEGTVVAMVYPNCD